MAADYKNTESLPVLCRRDNWTPDLGQKKAPTLAGNVIDGAAYSSAHIITAQNPSPSIVPFITPLAAARSSPSSSRSLSGESSGIREELDIRRIRHPWAAPPCKRRPSCEELKR